MCVWGIFPRGVTPILCMAVIILMVVGAAPRGEAAFKIPRRTVNMANDLGRGLDLTVHCKQKGEDLGEHLLHPNETYEFTFRPNFWGTTLYFCRFYWTGASNWLVVFSMQRDHDKCPVGCFWKIRQDKASRLSIKSHAFDDCFDWTPATFIPHLS
ncbi:S-protein homolog 2-like [Prosopis cineraria]|uniref:S-protein homolog 2-like n=1 Tax=Prosopis cineraria TaxID=364024 RepID=UPI00240FE98B|nr:S-protein homolog 2-like [Prosopis cineraria]